MQTFLPYPDFVKCARSLDKKRAFKQLVEAKQILCILRADHLPEEWKLSKSYVNQPYKNHPAVLMWKGYEEFLKHYYNVFLEHCLINLKIKTTLPPLDCLRPYKTTSTKAILKDWALDPINYDYPWWYNSVALHRSHRSRLIEKNEEFYIDKFPEDKGFNKGQYFWPDMERKIYKIINSGTKPNRSKKLTA